jgi:hypothetical protein
LILVNRSDNVVSYVPLAGKIALQKKKRVQMLLEQDEEKVA